MEFLKLAQERYSCRKFSETPVEKAKVEQILAAAMAAPTAVNKQPFKIWVLESEAAQKKVCQATRYTFGAKLFFVVGYKEDAAWVRGYDQRNFADVDASIVATHMMLEIQDLGLGTTWVGYFDAPKLRKLCPEMRDYALIAIFPVGYPALDAAPSPSHCTRKNQREAVEFL